MKNRSWRIFFIILLMLCVNLGLLLSVPTERSWVFNQFESYQNTNKRGFISRVYYDEAGVKHRFMIYIPYHLKSTDKAPVILYLNGFGENGNDGIKPFKNGLAPAIWEMKREFPFIAVLPQCPLGKSLSKDDDEIYLVMSILDQVLSEYPADPDRVSVSGISAGGIAAWEFAKRFPDRFSAVFPDSGFYNPADAIQIAENNVPIWNFYVRGDKENLVKANQEIFHQLLKAGYSPRFTELNGTLSDEWFTHDSWSFTFRNQALYYWLLNQNLKKRSSQKHFSLIFNEKDLSGWKVEAGDWSVTPEGVLECHKNDESVNPEITYENSHPLSDLHLEFKMADDDECNLIFISGNENSKGLRLNIISPNYGSGGILDLESGDYIQPSESLSQRSFRPNEWNDLRIHIHEDQLSVLLNGWNLHEIKSEKVRGLSGQFTLIDSSTKKSPVQWRYIRTRNLQ